MNELPIIQKTYDLVRWYIPIINRFPRVHKFTLGDRLINGLYELLEGLIVARYANNKLQLLQQLNGKLDIIRHQTRLLRDLNIIDVKRYEHTGKLITEIGNELGGWIKQQRQQNKPVFHNNNQPVSANT
jgi:23S rRNA-intervening sequence protein